MKKLIIKFIELYNQFLFVKITYFLLAFSLAVYAKIIVYDYSLLIKDIVGTFGIFLIFLPLFFKDKK